MPRNTAWRWAYGTGRLPDGTVLGFNLSEGFSGVGERSRENAVWIDGRPSALDARTRFEFDRTDVMRPWHVTTQDGTVRLRFDPVAAHNEFLDVKAVRSLFIQPVGHFSGEIDVDGRTHVLDRSARCRRGLGHPLVEGWAPSRPPVRTLLAGPLGFSP